jgi:hypothetical protein
MSLPKPTRSTIHNNITEKSAHSSATSRERHRAIRSEQGGTGYTGQIPAAACILFILWIPVNSHPQCLHSAARWRLSLLSEITCAWSSDADRRSPRQRPNTFWLRPKKNVIEFPKSALACGSAIRSLFQATSDRVPGFSSPAHSRRCRMRSVGRENPAVARSYPIISSSPWLKSRATMRRGFPRRRGGETTSIEPKYAEFRQRRGRGKAPSSGRATFATGCYSSGDLSGRET